MFRAAALSTLALLAACGTPQEQCIASNTRDLRVVERLLAETEANLRRGYALEEVTVFRTEYVRCGGYNRSRGGIGPGGLEPEPPEAGSGGVCLDDVADTETRPRAIDLGAEAAKRDGLVAKRRELTAAAEGAVAACRAAYPDQT